jgi:hypothetical protein
MRLTRVPRVLSAHSRITAYFGMGYPPYRPPAPLTGGSSYIAPSALRYNLAVRRIPRLFFFVKKEEKKRTKRKEEITTYCSST